LKYAGGRNICMSDLHECLQRPNVRRSAAPFL
jgi:hypothetical protein